MEHDSSFDMFYMSFAALAANNISGQCNARKYFSLILVIRRLNALLNTHSNVSCAMKEKITTSINLIRQLSL